jgi:protein gp37
MLGAFSDSVDFVGIDHVGAVPETWGYKRPCDSQWIEHIKQACIRDDVPFNMDHIVYETEKDKKYAIRH